MIMYIKQILAIIKYERRMLFRTPKFWVLALIGLGLQALFLFAFTIALKFNTDMPGEFLMSGFAGYIGFFFYSYLQAIVIIFVAADFRGQEIKAKLQEVLYSRPISNTQLILGKYFGVVQPLISLSIAIFVLSIISQFFMYLISGGSIGELISSLPEGGRFSIWPAAIYLLIMNIPAVLFMTAFVFVTISIVRVAPIAIIISLGYITSFFIFLRDKYHYMFDYGCFLTPMFYSDFTGIGEYGPLISQRLFYLALAAAFIAFTILLYPRLSSSKKETITTFAIGAIFLGLAIEIFMNRFDYFEIIKQLRAENFAVQEKFIDQPLPAIHDYRMDVQIGENDKLSCKVRLALQNKQLNSLENIILSLNPGLKIHSIEDQKGNDCHFKRQFSVIDVKLNQSMLPYANGTLTISYSGSIEKYGYLLKHGDKKKALINKQEGPLLKADIPVLFRTNCSYLIPESQWYPQIGVSYGYRFPNQGPVNYATAQISVTVSKDQMAITQGILARQDTSGDKICYQWVVKKPVPQFSLNTGPYSYHGRKFNNIELGIYHHKVHLVDIDTFQNAADTIFTTIDQILDRMEQTIGLKYPYQKLALVEIPFHFQWYADHRGIINPLAQPSIVQILETEIASIQLERETKKRTKRARSRGQDDSPKRIKRDIFMNYVSRLFFPSWRRRYLLYSLIPQFWNFQVQCIDSLHPLINTSLPIYLQERCEVEIRKTFIANPGDDVRSFLENLRYNEHEWNFRRLYEMQMDSIIYKLQHVPLSGMNPETDEKFFRVLMEYKAPVFFAMLEQLLGKEKFHQDLADFISIHENRPARLTDFQKLITSNSSMPMDWLFDQWIHQSIYPGYFITKAEAFKLDRGELNVAYQVICRIKNGEFGRSFVKLSIETEKDRVRKLVELDSYQEKEIRMVLVDKPKKLTVLPFLSRNRGWITENLFIPEKSVRAEGQDTVLLVQTLNQNYEIIVDDYDDGFKTPGIKKPLYFRPKKKKNTWRRRIDSKAYGRYYRALHQKNGGTGHYPVRWETVLDSTGIYELYYYLDSDSKWRKKNLTQKAKLTIYSDDSIESIAFNMKNAEQGWNFLGCYRFSSDSLAKVMLSDDADGDLIADAVKWSFVQK